MSKTFKLDIVYVEPVMYYNTPYKHKNYVASLKTCLVLINWYYRDKNKHMMLVVPERVGTSSPQLSVLTAFSDIVKVYNVSRRKCEVYNDITNKHLLITV